MGWARVGGEGSRAGGNGTATPIGNDAIGDEGSPAGGTGTPNGNDDIGDVVAKEAGVAEVASSGVGEEPETIGMEEATTVQFD